MQFGRIHGVALILLGFILIAFQFDLALTNKREAPSPYLDSRVAVQTHPSRFGALPGIVGGLSVVAGFAVFFTARRRDDPDLKNAVK
jgi:hypothetical protein